MSAKDLALKLLITARDEASGVLGRVSGALGKFAGIVLGVGSVASLAGLVQGLMSAAESAEGADKAQRILQATLDATGQAAGLTAADIADLAKELAGSTDLTKGQVRAGATMLATFKSIGGSMYAETLKLADGLERTGFGSYAENVKQLGKALEDPTRGLTMLARAGVTFTDQEETVIKGLMATGQAAKAQGIILQAVAGQVGGVAEAASGGIEGAKDRLEKATKSFKTAVGAGMLPALTKITDGMAGFWQKLADTGIAKKFGDAVGVVFDKAAAAALRFFGEIKTEELEAKLKQGGDTLKAWVDTAGAQFDTLAAKWQKTMSVGKVAGAAASGAWNVFQAGVDGLALAGGAVAAPFTGASLAIVAGLNQVGLASDAALGHARNMWDLNVDFARRGKDALVLDLGEAGRSFGLLGEGADAAKPKVAGAAEEMDGSARFAAAMGQGAQDAAAGTLKLSAAAVEARAKGEALKATLAAETLALDAQRAAGQRAADALKAVATAAQAYRDQQEQNAGKGIDPRLGAEFDALAASRLLAAGKEAEALKKVESGFRKLNQAAAEGDRYGTLDATAAWLGEIAGAAGKATTAMRALAAGDPADKAGKEALAALAGAVGGVGTAASAADPQLKAAAARARELAAAYQALIAAGVSAEEAGRRVSALSRAGTGDAPAAAPGAASSAEIARYRAAGMGEAEARRRAAEDAGMSAAAAREAEQAFRLTGVWPQSAAPRASAASPVPTTTPSKDAGAGAASARKEVEGAFAAPIPLTFEVTQGAAKASQDVVAAITQALAGASFSVPVRAVVTVDAGGAAPTSGTPVTPAAAPDPIARAADKTGTRTG